MSRKHLSELLHHFFRLDNEARQEHRRCRALDMIEAERKHQICTLGYTAEGDAAYIHGELSRAAGTYALNASCPQGERARFPAGDPPPSWPYGWSDQHWRPQTREADLVRAGALIVAELERMWLTPEPNAPLPAPPRLSLGDD